MTTAPDAVERTMSFGEHLEELRRRLIRAILGVALASCVTLFYGRGIITWLFEPLAVAQHRYGLPTQTYTRSAVSGFMVYLKVSLVAAFVVAAPWVLYQFWAFIRTGLYPSERRVFITLAPLSAVMTALGVLFMYYLFLPAAMTFLIYFTTTYPAPPPVRSGALYTVTEWFDKANEKTWELFIPGYQGPATRSADTRPATQPAQVVTVPVLDGDPSSPVDGQVWLNRNTGEMHLYEGGRVRLVSLTASSMMIPLIDPDDYIGEVIMLTLVIVLVFHVPVVMMLLATTGLLDPAVVRRYRKVFVFSCFVLAVFITPNQDIFSNVALPLLMWLLFEMGLVLMGIAWNRRAREAADAG